MRTYIKNLFSSLLVFLFAVFGTVSAWSLPSNGHLLQYQFAAQKTAFQSIDLPFAARAPQLTGENVTFTGTQLMGMGDARAYDGVGVQWASLNFDAELDATNRTVKVDVDAAKIKNSPDWKHLNEYKPNTKYELSNGDSFTTNANGQVTKQTYYPTSEAGKRTSTQTKVGKEGETGDVGGHGQPCSQGGTCDKYNLFPENGKLNNSSHKAAEARIRREFEAGNLDGPVTIRYGNVDPKTGRPERFEISYKTKNATEPTTVPFENVNPNGVN